MKHSSVSCIQYSDSKIVVAKYLSKYGDIKINLYPFSSFQYSKETGSLKPLLHLLLQTIGTLPTRNDVSIL